MPQQDKKRRGAGQGQKASQAKKSQERHYLSEIKRLERLGVYQPKSHELTKYRKYRVRKAEREYADFLQTQKFFFVPAGKKAREQAKKANIPITRTGFFFERNGYKRAKLSETKKGEFVLSRTGQVKESKSGKRKQRSKIWLAGIDTVDAERQRLIERAKKLKLGPGECYYFVITENGVEGYSRQAFTTIEQLISYLEKYDSTPIGKTWLFRHIEIRITKSCANYNRQYREKQKGQRRDKHSRIRRK